MVDVKTCLWFDGNGHEAAKFYEALIPGAELGAIMPGPDGNPLVVELTLGGVPYQFLNGGPRYRLSEAVSIVVQTDDQDETDRLWSALTADGGSESQCGWCKDRFGVSWQVVPKRLMKLFGDSDRAAAGRAMQAMLQMTKIDIAKLEAASKGSA